LLQTDLVRGVDFASIKRKALLSTWIFYFFIHFTIIIGVTSLSLWLGWRPHLHGLNWHEFYVDYQLARQICVLLVTSAFNAPDVISIVLYFRLMSKMRREGAIDLPLSYQDQSKASVLSTLKVHSLLCLLDSFSLMILTQFGTVPVIDNYLVFMIGLSVNGCWLPQMVIVSSFTKVNQVLRNCMRKVICPCN